MKFPGSLCLFLAMCSSQGALAQSEMVASPLPTWNVSAGVATLHLFNSQFDSHGTSTIYGWRGTASEYPYAAHLWIGGAAQVSGTTDTVANTGTPSLGSSTASGSVHLYTFFYLDLRSGSPAAAFSFLRTPWPAW